MSERIFVTIKYGDNQHTILNPNCRMLIFTEWLKMKCKYDKTHKLEGLSGSSKSPARSVSGKSRKSGKNSKLKSSPSPNINQR
uniref:Uncharacterized protein n=1 Tax=Octopus bimaculoides TaxID=37653 RepID=A0A0L8GUZ1_OCTBM